MNLSKLKTYSAHYALGVLASCWNAGIKAVKLTGGITTAACTVPAYVPIPNLATLLSVFGAAVMWEAIDYFSDNPLPVIKPVQPSFDSEPKVQ
jgi:hypothetical protein